MNFLFPPSHQCMPSALIPFSENHHNGAKLLVLFWRQQVHVMTNRSWFKYSFKYSLFNTVLKRFHSLTEVELTSLLIIS